MDSFEIAGFIFGVAGVWLTSRQNIWCFPVGLINVTISLFLFINHKLYSDAVQQVAYIILLSYGWYHWMYGDRSRQPVISRIQSSMVLTLTAMVIMVTGGMGYFFSTYTDADVPYLDAFATALSFAAQFLIARKVIENWLIWIFVNILYIGIYLYKDLYLYTLLFAIYLVLAVVGYVSWKKSLINLNTHQ